jgi:hypothetical protein
LIERISLEANFLLNSSNKLQPVNECFILFKTVRCADYALELEKIRLGGSGYNEMALSMPQQSSAMHATYRKIGGLLQSIKKIEEKLEALKVVCKHGRSKLPSTYIDRPCPSGSEVQQPPNLSQRRGGYPDSHAYCSSPVAPVAHTGTCHNVGCM